MLLPFLLHLVVANAQPQKFTPTALLNTGPGTSSSNVSLCFDGDLFTSWFPGWNPATYPAKAEIQFGRPIKFAKIRLYDGAGQPTLHFSAGATRITVHLDQYQQWREVAFVAEAERVTVELVDIHGDRVVPEIEFYGTTGTNAPITPVGPVTVVTTADRGDADKINLNGFHWLPHNKLIPFRSIRLFQSAQWTWQPAGLAVQPTAQANCNLDDYLTAAKAQGLDAFPTVHQTPDWMRATWPDDPGADAAPARRGMAKDDPAAYRDFAGYFFQLTARYGRKVWPVSALRIDTVPHWAPDGQLRRNVPKSGLNLLGTIEVWNEPDKWWAIKTYMQPEEYAAMLSACYDSIKKADPTMRVAMAGLTGIQPDYYARMLVWSKAHRPDRRLPCDVINVHHYSNKGNDERWPPIWTEACAPDMDARWYMMRNLATWAHAQNLPLWYSEFGYDEKEPSQQYIRPFGGKTSGEIKAEWLIRGYLEALAAGVDNCFVYNGIDEPAAANGGLWQTAGILLGEKDQQPFGLKPAYTAITQLIGELTGYTYLADLSPSTAVRVLAFRGKNNVKLAVWSPTAAGIKGMVNVGAAQLTYAEGVAWYTLKVGMSK